jgi:hypothetical protein
MSWPPPSSPRVEGMFVRQEISMRDSPNKVGVLMHDYRSENRCLLLRW